MNQQQTVVGSIQPLSEGRAMAIRETAAIAGVSLEQRIAGLESQISDLETNNAELRVALRQSREEQINLNVQRERADKAYRQVKSDLLTANKKHERRSRAQFDQARALREIVMDMVAHFTKLRAFNQQGCAEELDDALDEAVSLIEKSKYATGQVRYEARMKAKAASIERRAKAAGLTVEEFLKEGDRKSLAALGSSHCPD